MIRPRFIALTALLLTLASAASRVSAEEAKMNALQTALSSTTISGCVDTSIEWTVNQPAMQPPAPASPPRGWWRAFRFWLRLRGWS